MTEETSRWTPRQTEEVAALFRRLSTPGIEVEEYRAVREQIIEMNLPLVTYLTRRLANRTAPHEDLVQVGSVGLIKAVDRFDPGRGHEFVTYAAPVILGEIKRYLRDATALVRAPRRAQELRGAVMESREALHQKLGRAPTISEIAEHVGASGEEVVETIEVVHSRTGHPLDALVGPSAGALQQLVAIEEEGYDSAEARIDLRGAIADLSAMERAAVTLKFAEGKTQVEIAELLGVSQMQVSRLLRRSLAKMRLMLDEPTS
ncbi:sigma-70 family RNA polymerase sigma factor [Nocardioides nematodiphilus]|uniref:sigma-70 family RNA polymerase sigma factor n=1 Tax=Nocardioides nematodiphilus TaxID=2849669 RepID=UPI001CDA2EC8|nr:sigma-70 family RNA polymerase sigma factor [Nocardioides nematodiphilus]MCA1982710.1 sigma-70 family RNA polymerase sigma factor [Nocardioides nematodiphilus]